MHQQPAAQAEHCVWFNLFNCEQIKIRCFVKRVMPMTELTRKYIKAGMKKYTQNRAHARRTSESDEVTKERTDSQGCMRFVFDWFHNECPLVELNKDRPARLKDRKQFEKYGRNMERLTCEHHIMNGNVAEIAQSFSDSQTYNERQMKVHGFKMSLKTVETMIRPCMRQSDGCDCTCDKCSEITLVLKGLREAHGKVAVLASARARRAIRILCGKPR